MGFILGISDLPLGALGCAAAGHTESALLDGPPPTEGLQQVIHTRVHLAWPGCGGR